MTWEVRICQWGANYSMPSQSSAMNIVTASSRFLQFCKRSKLQHRQKQEGRKERGKAWKWVLKLGKICANRHWKARNAWETRSTRRCTMLLVCRRGLFEYYPSVAPSQDENGVRCSGFPARLFKEGATEHSITLSTHIIWKSCTKAGVQDALSAQKFGIYYNHVVCPRIIKKI